VASHEGKHPANHVLGRPGGKGDAALGFEHAAHFCHHSGRAGGEHVAKLAEYHVERCVGVGQFLGIALGPDDLIMPGNAGVFARLSQQLGCQVQRRNPCAHACRGEGDDAGASAYIQHRLACLDACKPH